MSFFQGPKSMIKLKPKVGVSILTFGRCLNERTPGINKTAINGPLILVLVMPLLVLCTI
jgi:hypothetical protein